MLTLGLDTAGTVLQVVLAKDGQVLAERSYAERRGQGEVLPVFIDELLAEAGATHRDIAVIGVATGPGSFTGLRMGLAGAQGLARATGCALFGLDRFTLVRLGCPTVERLVVVLDSLRDELFVQFGSEEPAMLMAAEIFSRICTEGWAVAGDGVACLGALPADVKILHPVGCAATLAQEAYQRRADEALRPPALPFYLRPPDITAPRA